MVDLELESGATGAISIGALLAGFVAFDSEPLTRVRWQLAAAPAIGAAAAIGALTEQPAWLAVAAIACFASVAGLSVAVSPRLAVAGLVCTLAMVLGQGLSVSAADAPDALVLGVAGAVLQAGFSLSAGLLTRARELGEGEARAPGGLHAAVASIADAVRGRGPGLAHALRWGIALGAATAVASIVDLGGHGYWIPLTVLFVLRPTPDETLERIGMRAAGTIVGLTVATPLAEALGGNDVLEATAIWIAAAFSFALLAIEYALFTAAITVFIVIESHALGVPAFEAADERGLATAIGIVIAATALLAFSRRGRSSTVPEARSA